MGIGEAWWFLEPAESVGPAAILETIRRRGLDYQQAGLYICIG